MLVRIKDNLNMYKQSNYIKAALAFLVVWVGLQSISQTPNFSKVPNFHPGDTASIARLVHNGIEVKQGRAKPGFLKTLCLPSR